MSLKYRVSARRLAAGLLAVLLLLASVGCVTVEPAEPAMTFEELLAETNIRRTTFSSAKAPYISAYTPDLRGQERIFSEDEMEVLTTPTPAKTVTAAEAWQDVNTLFRLLKHSYAAYDYFGGNKVFYAAREKALDALPAEGSVSPSRLENILVDVLDPILTDRHFRIEGRSLPSCKAVKCWYVPDLYFNDVTAVEDAVSQYVRITVDRVGRLRYCLVAYVTEEEAQNLPQKAQIGERTVSLRWKKDSSVSVITSDAFVETTLGEDIPYLAVTTLGGEEEEHSQQLDLFAESGKTYADAPLLVMDLRGNGGGNSRYVNQWFKNYTGRYPPYPQAWFMKYSKLNLYAIHKVGKEEWLSDDIGTGEWERYRYKGRFQSQAGITFFIADRNTASAAERMLLTALTMKNTVIVGGDSLGCSLVVNNLYFYLPASGVEIRLGTAMSLFGDLGNFDGIGIEPDIWTPSKDAADAVVRLVEYYGLNE